jgi:sugar-specific transcriptional regulator TrmB
MSKTEENSLSNVAKSTDLLQKENDSLRELLKEAIIEIENLKNRLEKHENPKDEYNKRWTMVTKIAFLISKAQKPLRSSEILQLLTSKEPTIIKKQASMEKYLSAFLNTAMKHGRLIPHKLKGVRGNYYCLPEWINEEGELLPEMTLKIF